MTSPDNVTDRWREKVTALRDASRTTEFEVQHKILECMADESPWTNAQLKNELRRRLPLSGSDRARANKRPNEEKWEELVNNALSPSRSNSLPAKGYTEPLGRGVHRITPKGLGYIRNRQEESKEFEKYLAETLEHL